MHSFFLIDENVVEAGFFEMHCCGNSPEFRTGEGRYSVLLFSSSEYGHLRVRTAIVLYFFLPPYATITVFPMGVCGLDSRAKQPLSPLTSRVYSLR